MLQINNLMFRRLRHRLPPSWCLNRIFTCAKAMDLLLDMSMLTEVVLAASTLGNSSSLPTLWVRTGLQNEQRDLPSMDDAAQH